MAPPRALPAKGKRKANNPTSGDNGNNTTSSASSSSGGGSANLTAAQQLLLNPAAENIQPNTQPNINVNVNPAAPHHHSQNSNNNNASAGANASGANTDPNHDHDPRTCGCCNLAADAATYTAEERAMMAAVAANVRAQMVAAGRITGAEDTRAIVERQEREREREEAAVAAAAAAATRDGAAAAAGVTATRDGESESEGVEMATATATAMTTTTAMEGVVLAGDAGSGVQQQEEGESGGAVDEGRVMQEFTFVDEGPALMMASAAVAEDDHPMQESGVVIAEDLVPMEESATVDEGRPMEEAGGLVGEIPAREELFAVAEALGRYANRGPPDNNAGEAMVLDKPSGDAGNDSMLGDGKGSEHDKDKNKNSDDNVSNINEERMETENVTSAAESTRTDQPSETTTAAVPDNGAPNNENEVSASAKELEISANKIQNAANKLHEIADAFDKGPAAGVALVERDNSRTDNTSAIQPPASPEKKKKKAPAATPAAKNTRSRAARSRSSAASAAAAGPAASTSATAAAAPAAPAAPELGYMTIFHIANEQEAFDARIYSLLTPSAALSCERERYAEWWRRSHGHVGKLPPATLPVPNDFQDPRARWRLDKRVGRDWSEQECAPAAGPVGTAKSVEEPLLDAQGNLRLPAKALRRKQAGSGKGGVVG
ncbi:hypothetical protein SLS58_008472 [Diplodia intermedia]|uniref:Uncharacterized protein n=1 Tax=Diplodia intermedia TaxID=856260 RepID=A0ABR3THF9_9PEZI